MNLGSSRIQMMMDMVMIKMVDEDGNGNNKPSSLSDDEEGLRRNWHVLFPNAAGVGFVLLIFLSVMERLMTVTLGLIVLKVFFGDDDMSVRGSNVTPILVLDEIIALSGETEMPKVMKILFEQHFAEEEAFTKYIRDKIADVKASLTRVRTGIRKMESMSDKDAWKDAIVCFKETKDRLELKLSRLTQLANKNFDGVKELKVHFAIMDLCK
nr:hypothetical protein [Tanacetum cinerariifolium]